ncbi:MAG: hypothetical protein JXR25_07890 [Pontiellaceae bacterium]|nr:hypothetical protein [Pontiellaceae bacterium]MBN2784732.1 hypothetical protein [Pontiellaceae bacterium]
MAYGHVAYAVTQSSADAATHGACGPDQLPDLMDTALKREDVLAWAADQEIKAIRPAISDKYGPGNPAEHIV